MAETSAPALRRIRTKRASSRLFICRGSARPARKVLAASGASTNDVPACFRKRDSPSFPKVRVQPSVRAIPLPGTTRPRAPYDLRARRKEAGSTWKTVTPVTDEEFVSQVSAE